MRILAVQMNPIIGDFTGNFQKILQGISSARKKKAQLVVFPELALCGYPPEDLLLHEDFSEECEAYISKLEEASKGIAVVVGIVRKNRSFGEKPLCNSAGVFYDGKLLGFHDKWLLPTYDVFDERRYFEPGNTVRTWDLYGKKVAVLVCEDMWEHAGCVGWTKYRKDPIVELISQKPDIVINISSSPYHFQKVDQRVQVCAKSSATLQCPVLLCCQVGGNDQLVFDGYSMYVDPQGNVRKMAAGFTEDELFIDDAEDLPIVHTKYDPIKDLYAALVLGVRDYFFKQGLKKACLGLSGGVDSALCACIATDALGKENVTAIAMPSRFSSEASLEEAKALAKNLQIRLEEISIEPPFCTFLTSLDPLFHGMKWDSTEENIQARIRGILLMAYSNKMGCLVISTGNKSEIACGYCTLYGDMCGGLAVISDVVKTQVYELCHFLNRSKETIPRSTIERPPSAELRENQKDSDTLPEYDLLDKVLQAYVEEYLSPQEICKKFGFAKEVVDRIIGMIHKAEYKRRQMAPGIRVSKKAFRVGRRFPIVQKWK